MAEALATLGVAANIAQFVGLSMQLVSSCKEIYKSAHGLRQDYEELQTMIENTQVLHKNLVTSLSAVHVRVLRGPSRTNIPENEKAIIALANKCEPISDELLTIITGLKVPKDAKFRAMKVVGKSFQYVWKSNEIQNLKQRIIDLDAQLKDRVSILLHIHNHSDIVAKINNLDKEHSQLHSTTSQTLDTLRKEVLSMISQKSDDQSKELSTITQIANKLSTLAETANNMKSQHALLKSLNFDAMKIREDGIKDTHPQTSEWVFDPKVSYLTEWLTSENGVFWVKGKPGSGKSTLMKFLHDHEQTLSALKQWATPNRLVTASFYFWNAGSSMQKSQQGLLRSLLYQIVLETPDIDSLTSSIIHIKAEGSFPHWTRSQLINALLSVARARKSLTKFCFFIDGLDEYEGESEDLIQLLRDLATSPNIKICASSRPWNAFWNEFDASKWKLKVEEFTRDDMRKYTNETLNANPGFHKFTEQNRKNIQDQIAHRSQGVWLWVYLVVRDLLKDISGDEDYDHLQVRIDSFPQELDDYFRKMLQKIDKIYRQQSARILLLAIFFASKIPVLALQFLKAEEQDPDYAYDMPTQAVSRERDIIEMFSKWKKLLKSRCGDLLEIEERQGYFTAFNAASHGELRTSFGFIHRTVRDFLCDEFLDELKEMAGNYNWDQSYCKTMLAIAKVYLVAPKDKLPLEASEASEGLNNTQQRLFLRIAEDIFFTLIRRPVIGKEDTRILDTLDSVGCEITSDYSNHHWAYLFDGQWEQRGTDSRPVYCTDFMGLAIKYGLFSYVSAKLEENPGLFSGGQNGPYLYFALYNTDRVADIRMLELLMSHHVNPNDKSVVSGSHETEVTVWQEYLDYLAGELLEDPNSLPKYFKAIILLLLDHGADTEVIISSSQESTVLYLTVTDIVRRFFEKEDADEVYRKIEERREIESKRKKEKDEQQSSISRLRTIFRWS